MVQKPLFWLLFLAIVFIASLKFSSEIHPHLLYLSDAIKVGFLDMKEGFTNNMRRHFNQMEEIDRLSEELRDKEKLQSALIALDSELKSILGTFSSSLQIPPPNIHLVRTLSYAEIGDYYKIWLDHSLDNFSSDKIYGLIKDGFVAGIVINRQGRALGLLNGDERCSYSVFIGQNRSPGIVRALENGKIIADFIPSWLDINEGDEVVTSGLDGIFFENLKVGRVNSVRQSQGYLIAELTPYVDVLHPHYFWLVDTKESAPPMARKKAK